ncbi:hypothetical protein J3Q64DRAFT_1005990 [Phycomyces blakesleeanus]|uniref:Uncharacterized protein n=1 Tax=Phycomyces blakesleeanus TaxID=4837 RepID=A0ABR3BB57_PHYBL
MSATSGTEVCTTNCHPAPCCIAYFLAPSPPTLAPFVKPLQTHPTISSSPSPSKLTFDLHSGKMSLDLILLFLYSMMHFTTCLSPIPAPLIFTPPLSLAVPFWRSGDIIGPRCSTIHLLYLPPSYLPLPAWLPYLRLKNLLMTLPVLLLLSSTFSFPSYIYISKKNQKPKNKFCDVRPFF